MILLIAHVTPVANQRSLCVKFSNCIFQSPEMTDRISANVMWK